jgi:hypothetical protein
MRRYNIHTRLTDEANLTLADIFYLSDRYGWTPEEVDTVPDIPVGESREIAGITITRTE